MLIAGLRRGDYDGTYDLSAGHRKKASPMSNAKNKRRGESIDALPFPAAMPAQRAMNAKLLIVLGNTTKREVSLQLPAVLGRSRTADITVAHPLISRRHCEISENNGLLMLRDLASLNGTMIGSRPVKTAPLLPNAEFTIGLLTFRVAYQFDGDPASVPAICYVDQDQAKAATSPSTPASTRKEQVPHFGVEEPLPFEAANESVSGEFVMPDFMALADADPDHVIPPAPVFPKPARPATPANSPWATSSHNRLPAAPIPRGPDEPLEVDSSLQSGGHLGRSPRATEAQTPKNPQAAMPPKHTDSTEANDPNFGDFLKGLR